MGLFDKKGVKEVSRTDFWKEVKSYKGPVPHTTSKLSFGERKKLAKRAISPHGSEGSKVQSWEVGRMFRRLESERKGFKREARRLERKGDLKGAKELVRGASRLRKEMQTLGRVVGGRHGRRQERRTNW